jgi:N-acetylglucosaminyl-diphospho-decaprenol L-rhamnosyltransferase
MTLGIVILNFNTADLTVACLRSVLDDAADSSTRIVIVDNGSTDGSPQKISAAIAGIPSVQLLALLRNGGFAYGNNRGIELLRDADYVLLLNSDVIVHRGCLTVCLKIMESDKTIGVMSCLVKNADGSPQNVARKFPTPLRAILTAFGLPTRAACVFAFANTEDATWDRATTKRNVDWLGGAFFFISGAALQTCGLLDEDFFFYGEDIEFCHRLRQHGYRCHYDPSSSITHFGGGSNSPNQQALRRHARYLVQRKCYGRFAATLVRCADALAARLRAIFR